MRSVPTVFATAIGLRIGSTKMLVMNRTRSVTRCHGADRDPRIGPGSGCFPARRMVVRIRIGDSMFSG